MANKYYGLNTTDVASWLTSVRDALVDKYGDGVTIDKFSTSEIVFTCPAISEKSIRLTNQYAYYGTVADTTFTSDKTFLREYTYYFNKLKHLVLGDEFVLLTGNDGNANVLIIIAKTVNEVSLFCGGMGASSSTFNPNSSFNAIKNGEVISNSIDFVDFGTSFYCNLGTPYKSKLLIIDTNNDKDMLLRKSDGTPDTINGLFMSSVSKASSRVAGGFMSDSSIYTTDGVLRLRTSLLAEI